MCRVEESVYIDSAGSRKTFEETFTCDRSFHGVLCSNVKRRRYQYNAENISSAHDDRLKLHFDPLDSPTPTSSGTYLVHERRPSRTNAPPSAYDGQNKSLRPQIIIELGSKKDLSAKYNSVSVSTRFGDSSDPADDNAAVSSLANPFAPAMVNLEKDYHTLQGRDEAGIRAALPHRAAQQATRAIGRAAGYEEDYETSSDEEPPLPYITGGKKKKKYNPEPTRQNTSQSVRPQSLEDLQSHLTQVRGYEGLTDRHEMPLQPQSAALKAKYSIIIDEILCESHVNANTIPTRLIRQQLLERVGSTSLLEEDAILALIRHRLNKYNSGSLQRTNSADHVTRVQTGASTILPDQDIFDEGYDEADTKEILPDAVEASEYEENHGFRREKPDKKYRIDSSKAQHSTVDVASDSGYRSGVGTDTASVCSIDSIGSSLGLPQDFLSKFIALFGDILIEKAGARDWAGYALAHKSPEEIEQRLMELLKTYTSELSREVETRGSDVSRGDQSSAHNQLLVGATNMIRRYRPKIARYFCETAVSPPSDTASLSERLQGLGQQLSLSERISLFTIVSSDNKDLTEYADGLAEDGTEDDIEEAAQLFTDLGPVRNWLISHEAFHRLSLDLRRGLYQDDTLATSTLR